MKRLDIGMLGYEGVNAVDLVGPLEAFSQATVFAAEAGRDCGYRLHVIGLDAQPFSAESGVVFMPQYTLTTAPALDTLIVAGGSGLRLPQTNTRVAQWLQTRIGNTRRVATICTGIYGLAPTGALDGRNVTTHWRFAADVARRFPALKVDGDALFTKDGPYYTSAGVTAGIDLALALIEDDLGPAIALAVARDLVVYLKRPGSQAQYSEPLRFQAKADNRFADLTAWASAHLDAELTIDTLAARACLGPRHFSRRFREAFGCTPATWVDHLRLTEARQRLDQAGATVEQVGISVGFRSADAFRRAFERRFGLSPSAYQARFGPARAAAVR